MLLKAFEQFGPRTAFDQADHQISYDAVAGLIGRLANLLAQQQIHGRTVAALSSNRFEAWCLQIATHVAGGRFVALSALMSFEDQLFICEDSEAAVLVVDPDFTERALTLSAACTNTLRTFALGASSELDDLLALAHELDPLAISDPSGGSDSVCSLVYTSGTTGQPKGVMHTPESLGNGALEILACGELPDDVQYLACAPITHAAGMFVVPTLLRGGTVVVEKRFEAKIALSAIESGRVTCTFLVPTMIYALLDVAGGDQRASRLERVFYGGSPISPARLREAAALFGPVFTQVYGQAECLSGMVLRAADHDLDRPERLAACGRAMPGTALTLLDDDLRPVPQGEIGEICIRSRSAMTGYWKRPDLTTSAFAGGWLHTGDLASVDGEGFFTIVDRKKDMIISGGFNVYPKAIEDVLTSETAVAMAAVFGVPDDKWGEAVKALVVPRAGCTVDLEKLSDLVRQRKGPLHVPKSFEIVDELPLTAVGKIDKKALRAPYWRNHHRAVS